MLTDTSFRCLIINQGSPERLYMLYRGKSFLGGFRVNTHAGYLVLGYGYKNFPEGVSFGVDSQTYQEVFCFGVVSLNPKVS